MLKIPKVWQAPTIAPVDVEAIMAARTRLRAAMRSLDHVLTPWNAVCADLLPNITSPVSHFSAIRSYAVCRGCGGMIAVNVDIGIGGSRPATILARSPELFGRCCQA